MGYPDWAVLDHNEARFSDQRSAIRPPARSVPCQRVLKLAGAFFAQAEIDGFQGDFTLRFAAFPRHGTYSGCAILPPRASVFSPRSMAE